MDLQITKVDDIMTSVNFLANKPHATTPSDTFPLALNDATGNETNISDTSPGTSRGVRISMSIISLLSLSIASIVCINLIIAGMYNSATNDLYSTIHEYDSHTSDIGILLDKQVHNHDKFDEIARLSWIEFPHLQQSIAQNKKISEALMHALQRDFNAHTDSATNDGFHANTSEQNNSSDNHSHDDTQNINSTSDETKNKMKTLTDKNATNLPQNTVQQPQSHTKKPW